MKREREREREMKRSSVRKQGRVEVQRKGFFSWGQKEMMDAMLIGNNLVLTKGEDERHTIDVRTDLRSLKLGKEFVSLETQKNRYRLWTKDSRRWHKALTRLGRKSSGLDRSNRVLVPLESSHWFDPPTIDLACKKLKAEGDEVISMTDDVYYITDSNVHVYGRFMITNYSILFAYFEETNVEKHERSHDFFYVPMGLCKEIDIQDGMLIIKTKDLREMTFAYAGNAEKWNKLFSTLKWIAFPNKSHQKSEKDLMAMLETEEGRAQVTKSLRHTSLLPPRKLYVYERQTMLSDEKKVESQDLDWRSAMLLTEYTRQGIGVDKSALRFTDVNQEYKLCETYPRVLVTLDSMSDKDISKASEFRSKSRLPTCTYYCREKKRSLWRSAQPLVGAGNARSSMDEMFLKRIGDDDDLCVLDCRPKLNAFANQLGGKGTITPANSHTYAHTHTHTQVQNFTDSTVFAMFTFLILIIFTLFETRLICLRLL